MYQLTRIFGAMAIQCVTYRGVNAAEEIYKIVGYAKTVNPPFDHNFEPIEYKGLKMWIDRQSHNEVVCFYE